MLKKNDGGFSVDTEVFESDNVSAKKRISNEIIDWLRIFSVVVVVIVLIFTFIIKPATIVGKSMEDTLYENEKVLITDLFYTPKRGDIVVISRNVQNIPYYDKEYENSPIIKRVIATEFQQVDIDFETGIVYVDGEPLDEPYTKTPTTWRGDVSFPVTVKEGCVFVLGDNRNNSRDSRSSDIGDYGMIDTRYILGRAICRIYPLNKFGVIK